MSQPHAHALEQLLDKSGFTRSIQDGEVEYSRHHERDGRLRVVVHTGISTAGRHGYAKPVRVETVFVARKTYTIKRPVKISTNCVERVLLDRVLCEMREAYSRGSKWLASKPYWFDSQEDGQATTRGGFERISAPKTPLDEI